MANKMESQSELSTQSVSPKRKCVKIKVTTKQVENEDRKHGPNDKAIAKELGKQ